MKVIHGVRKEGNVICIIQICEMSTAQREADCGGNTFHDPIDCMTEQSGCKNAALSTYRLLKVIARGWKNCTKQTDTWSGGEAGREGRADPNTRRGAVMQILY